LLRRHTTSVGIHNEKDRPSKQSAIVLKSSAAGGTIIARFFLPSWGRLDVRSLRKQVVVTRGSLAFFCRMVLALCAIYCASINPAVPQQRIPGQPPRQVLSALLGTAIDQDGLPVIGLPVRATNRSANKSFTAITNSEGVFRLRDLPPGEYEVTGTREGFALSAPVIITLAPGKIQQARLTFLNTGPSLTTPPGPSGIPGLNTTLTPEAATSGYPGLRTPQVETVPPVITAEILPLDAAIFSPKPYRWTVQMPEWNRYQKPGEFPYAHSHL
jgi:Carboxypeptidase regulatory-like domain